jgi:hypothetical protein
MQLPARFWLVDGASPWRSGDGKTLFRTWQGKMTTSARLGCSQIAELELHAVDLDSSIGE